MLTHNDYSKIIIDFKFTYNLIVCFYQKEYSDIVMGLESKFWVQNCVPDTR